ncbi:MAG: hypothetical protein ACE5JB_09900 [bacterium]
MIGKIISAGVPNAGGIEDNFKELRHLTDYWKVNNQFLLAYLI